VGPLFQYLGFAFGIYWLARRFTRNNLLCLGAALLPLWFTGYGNVNDLIFLLRRNIVMVMIPFAMAIGLKGDNRDNELKILPIAIAGAAAVFYYFDVSTGLFTSQLPLALRDALQPGFAITGTAFAFGLHSAVVQDFYAAFVSTVLFFVALRLSGSHEKKLLVGWYLVSAAGILIEFRLGMILSMLLLGVFVLRRYPSSPVPPVLGVVGLAFLGILLEGSQSLYDALGRASSSILYFVSQGVTENPLGASLSDKTQFLFDNYGYILLIFLLSLFSLTILEWRDKSARRMLYIPILGLVLYFFPFPSPFYFFVFVTPFVGITIALALERFYSFVESTAESDAVKPVLRASSGGSAGPTRRSRIAKADSPKIVYVAVVCVILLVGGGTLTLVYQDNITYFGGQPGVPLTSFSAQDLSAANWLKSNFPPTTLIISDPATVQELAGLAGLPYTVEGYTLLNGLQPVLSQADVNLSETVVTTLSLQSITNLTGLYLASDKYMGFNSSNLKIVIVVNNRTSWWANGEVGYASATNFTDFPGLASYSSSPLISSVFEISPTYKIYTIAMGVGTSSAAGVSSPAVVSSSSLPQYGEFAVTVDSEPYLIAGASSLPLYLALGNQTQWARIAEG
jgi:hypothetical protein